MRGTRAQSHVVGVALMLGLAVTALGALTLGVGTVIDAQASNADTTRLAGDMTAALEGVERTGSYSHHLRFTEGHLRAEDRTLRLLDEGEVIRNVSVGAMVFESGDRRVASVAGATVRGSNENAWLVDEPPVTSSSEVLVVGAPVIDDEMPSLSGQSGVQTTLRTNITHHDEELGSGEFAVAIETETPEPFERYFDRQGLATQRVQFQGDSHESVLAIYPGERTGYLVVHDLNLEVSHG